MYRRRGRSPKILLFGEFIAEAEATLELREWGEPEGDDDGRCLEMLRICADLGNYGTLEDCYQLACKSAVLNVESWWEEICAVAERLKETGQLDEAELPPVIESTWGCDHQDDIELMEER